MVYRQGSTYNDNDFQPRTKPPDSLDIQVVSMQKTKHWRYKFAIFIETEGVIIGCNEVREGLNSLRTKYPETKFSFKLDGATCWRTWNV